MIIPSNGLFDSVKRVREFAALHQFCVQMTCYQASVAPFCPYHHQMDSLQNINWPTQPTIQIYQVKRISLNFSI